MFQRRSAIPVHLPMPDGPYVPGCFDVMVGFGAESTYMRLYYPSALQDIKAESSQWTRWLNAPQYLRGLAALSRTYHFVIKLAMKYVAGDIHIPAVWGSPLIEDSKVPNLPVVVLSHGLGSSLFLYSFLSTQLASYGFLVAAVEHRDESSAATYFYVNEDKFKAGKKSWLPFREVDDGGAHLIVRKRQLQVRASECSKALDLLHKINAGHMPSNLLDPEKKFSLLDTLANRMDLGAASLMGHSFGGATALLAAAIDKRFKQMVVLDAWMFGHKEDQEIPKVGADVPKIYINTQTFQEANNLDVMRRFVQPTDSCYTVRESVHHHQCDTPFVFGVWCDLDMRNRLDPLLSARLTAHLLLRFLHERTGKRSCWNNEEFLAENDHHLCPAISIHEQTASKL